MPIRAHFQYMLIFPIQNISEPGLIQSVKGGFAYIKFLRIRPFLSKCGGKGSKTSGIIGNYYVQSLLVSDIT